MASRRVVLRWAVGSAWASAGVLGAACEAGGGAGPAPQAISRGPVTLTFLSWRPIAMDQFEPAWTEYGRRHNVTFEVDKSGDGDQVKITTMFAADTGPDVFDPNTRNLPKMYDSGFVLQLDRYLSRDRLSFDRDWAPIGIERWRQKTYAVPYWNEPFAIYYNKTVFKQKGIDDPWTRSRNQGDWTLEEMVEAARKLNDPANDVWGLQWGLTGWEGLGPLIWPLGVSHMQYDPQIEVKLQLPEVAQANTWAMDWQNRLKVNVAGTLPEMAAARDRIQGGRPAIDRSGGTNLFATGKIGIHWRSVNDWRRMWPVIGNAFEWDMLPCPTVNGRPGCSWTAGHPVCAYSKTKHPDETWEFMKWMMGDEFQGYLAEHQYLVPAKKSHQAKYFRVPSEFPYQHPQVFANVYKRPYGVHFSHYNAVQTGQVYSAEMTRIFNGEVPLQGGLRELERRLNAEIDYGGGENPFKGLRWPIQPK